METHSNADTSTWSPRPVARALRQAARPPIAAQVPAIHSPRCPPAATGDLRKFAVHQQSGNLRGGQFDAGQRLLLQSVMADAHVVEAEIAQRIFGPLHHLS